MKIDRLLSIIMVLIEQNKISASKLAEMFEVTPRTIYRDIETIQAAGVPIVTYTGTNGGIGILENYKIDKKFFTKEDMITIMTGLGSISSSVTNSGLNKVLTKLQSLIPEDHTQEIKLKSGQVVIDLTTWSGNKKLQANLIKIKEALNQRRYLIFKYLDGNGKSTERKVEPYQLLWKEEKWYINSYCTMRNDFRLFKLSRISYLKVLDETFSLREFDRFALFWRCWWRSALLLPTAAWGRSVKSVLIWIPPSVLSTLFPMLLVNCWMAYRRRWPRVTN